MDAPTDGLREKHLWNIGHQLSSTCPAASRYYMFTLEQKLVKNPKLLKAKAKRNTLYCPHCGNIWSPGNHRVRVLPCRTPNRCIKKLMKQKDQHLLTAKQKRRIKDFMKSSNKIVYTCFLCKKKTDFPGTKRAVSDKINPPSSVSSSTPKLKIKRQKDLSAGLCIASPSPSAKPPGTKSKTPSSLSKKKTLLRTSVTPIRPNQRRNSSSAGRSSSGKKRKSLLSNITQRDEESKKKKIGLASFLVSL